MKQEVDSITKSAICDFQRGTLNIITLFATSATAKSKEKKEKKKHTNTQTITTKQLNENAQKHSV